METFYSSIILWPLNWAPAGYLLCQGQELLVNQYPALYSLIGQTYGGSGQSTFKLPDLRTYIPVGKGQIPGSLNLDLGKTTGEAQHTLNANEMASHSHAGNIGGVVTLAVSNANAGASVPTAGSSISVAGTNTGGVFAPRQNFVMSEPDTTLNLGSIGISTQGSGVTAVNTATGGSQAHNNMQPYLVLNAIISIDGPVYPDFND